VFSGNGNLVRDSLDTSEYHAWKKTAARHQVKREELESHGYACRRVIVSEEPKGTTP
jgi:hypothetical protein